MDFSFNSILSIILIPKIVELIIKNDGLDEQEALNEFYNSKTYDVLEREEAKVWHFSPLTLYHMWKSEKETGEIEFPEE